MVYTSNTFCACFFYYYYFSFSKGLAWPWGQLCIVNFRVCLYTTMNSFISSK